MKRALLINPTIHDFSAYDFWARPLGLMTVAGYLQNAGIHVDYLDLTDANSHLLPQSKKPKRRAFGHGKFYSQPIERPAVLPYINRKYRRYGLPPEITLDYLKSLEKPDAVLITSMMTYWYPGVFEAVELVRETWKNVPVILGGVYATLCEEHAKAHSKADFVMPGPLSDSIEALSQIFDESLPPFDVANTLPAHRLAKTAFSAPFAASTGCPFNCPYCGIKALSSKFIKYPMERIKAELELIANEMGIVDIAIYDDAFLQDRKRALEILELMANLENPVRLHAASGLSCRGMKPDIARAMVKAGATTIRIGLETADEAMQKKLGGKVFNDEFRDAVENLRTAGFDLSNAGAYLMAAMPGQSVNEVKRGIDEVIAAGIQPHLSEYSPIPKSPMFHHAVQNSKFDLSEPLFHNPTLLPCASKELTHKTLSQLKKQMHIDYMAMVEAKH